MSFDLRNPRDWVTVLPDLVKLMWRAVRDERVPTWVRAGLVGVAGYMVLPVDIVPDWVPFAGQLDDLLVLTLGVRTLLRRIPEDILLEHWDGDLQVLGSLSGRELGPGAESA